MSEDAEGLSPGKPEETEITNSLSLQGNLNDIFEDDDAEFSLGMHDDMLDRQDESTEFDSTFDDVSPPVSKKIKVPPNESALPPQPPTMIASDLIQDKVQSTGAWQDDEDHFPHRREIILKIAKVLKDRKPNPSRDWVKDLPYKARKLEEQLYKTAPSLKEYLNEATFRNRLMRVAQAIASQHKLIKGKSVISGSNKRVSKRGSDSSLGSRLSTPSTGNSVSNGSGHGNAISVGSGDLTALERQQRANATLEEQILENIRQQQMIMRNLTQNTSDQIMAAAMVSQANPLVASMGTNPLSNQMTGQLAGINDGLGVMHNAMGGMNNAMGMAATNTSSFNGINGNGGMNAGGMNVGGMNLGNMGNGGVGVNMGGMNTAGLNIGGGNSMGVFNHLGLHSGGLSLAGMNNASVNPLLLQQFLQQQQQQQQQQMAATQQSPAAVQMAMLNFRNSLTGQSNRTAMDTSALMNSSMSSATAAPLAGSSGINPTMPPPSLSASMRSSFTSESGINSLFPQDGGTGSTDLSLSPNSYKWL